MMLKKMYIMERWKNIENKIPDITKLATNTALNVKINRVKSKIPNITNSATTTALTALENKIPNVSNLIKKTDYNTKISEIKKKITDQDHDEYITTLECNKLASGLAQADLATNDIAALIKETDFNNKPEQSNKIFTSNKAKHVLVENEFNGLSKKVKAISTKGLTKDLINKFSILNGAKYFSSGIFQNYLEIIPPKNMFNIIHGNLMECQQNIKNITKSGSNFAPTFVDYHLLPDINFDGHCLIKLTFLSLKK